MGVGDIDELKPICKRCQKGGFTCEGYRNAIVWVDQNEKLSRKAGLKKTGLTLSSRDSSGRSSQFDDLSAISRSPSPFSIDVYMTFTIQQLFGHGDSGPDHDDEVWLSSIIRDHSTRVSYTAFKCLATTYFGRIQRQPDVVRKGTALYGKALRQLRDSIQDMTTAYDCRNVAATIALVHYESIAYTDRYGWIQHAGGTGRLIEMRGPERHQDEPEHTYFLLSRSRIIMQAIMSRKRVFLERPEWQTVPWTKRPNSKTPVDNLIDIMAHIPGIFAECDRLSRLANVPEGEGGLWHRSRRALGPEQGAWEVLRGQLIAALQRLEQWRQDWQARQTPTLQAEEKPPDPLTSLTWDPNLEYPAKTIHYATLATGYEVALYLIALAILGSMATSLRDPDDTYRQVMEHARSDHVVLTYPLNTGIFPYLNKDPSNQQRQQQKEVEASVGVGDSEGAGSSLEGQSPPSQQHSKKKLNVLPPLATPIDQILNQVAELLDYLLLEPHRGKGTFTAMVLLRICFLGFVGLADEPRVLWTVRTLQRLADATSFDLSRHMDGYTILGGGMKLGSFRQREMVDRIMRKSTYDHNTSSGGGGGGVGGRNGGAGRSIQE